MDVNGERQAGHLCVPTTKRATFFTLTDAPDVIFASRKSARMERRRLATTTARTTGSMGVDAADYDGCGRPSIWVTNFDASNTLSSQRVWDAAILFRHLSSSSGIDSAGMKRVGWGTAFLDLDHHGWEDIVFVNGHVYRDPSGRGNSRLQTPVLLRNLGDGTFQNQNAQGGPYFQCEHRAARSSAISITMAGSTRLSPTLMSRQ